MSNGDMPAIPVMDEVEGHGQHYGLTKREHFAGLAMQALSNVPEASSNEVRLAQWSVDLADALLEALEEKSNESD